jgi:TPR repeat protein
LCVCVCDVRAIDRDELAGLVKRGQALLGGGDIASARLLLRRAAEAGDGNAALILATTYDRTELAKLKVIGVAPDHAQAKAWYTKAVEHGSAEAVRRLQQLAQRGD